jgi:hypothetical protein
MPVSTPQPLPASVVAVMAGAVDYAGLFPPAGLSMAEALKAYTAALAGDNAWLLGRFVVPATRLAELRLAAAAAPAPLHLSVIVTDRSDADVAALSLCDGAPLVLDAIECKPRDLDGIDWLASAMARHNADVYVEVDPAVELPRWFDRLSARGLRAKLRTGGTAATAFPTPRTVIEFMTAAVGAGVPFKATAGLHHAVRGRYRLTYEPGSPEAVMHGYLNVLLAAATLRAGRSGDIAEQVLEQHDAASLVFDDEAIRWNAHEWPASVLHATRTDGLIGFGSCSIAEPADEIRALMARRHAQERS